MLKTRTESQKYKRKENCCVTKKKKTKQCGTRRKSNGKYYYWLMKIEIENRMKFSVVVFFFRQCSYEYRGVKANGKILISYSVFNQLLMSEIMLQLHDFSSTSFFLFFLSFYFNS